MISDNNGNNNCNNNGNNGDNNNGDNNNGNDNKLLRDAKTLMRDADNLIHGPCICMCGNLNAAAAKYHAAATKYIRLSLHDKVTTAMELAISTYIDAGNTECIATCNYHYAEFLAINFNIISAQHAYAFAIKYYFNCNLFDTAKECIFRYAIISFTDPATRLLLQYALKFAKQRQYNHAVELYYRLIEIYVAIPEYDNAIIILGILKKLYNKCSNTTTINYIALEIIILELIFKNNNKDTVHELCNDIIDTRVRKIANNLIDACYAHDTLTIDEIIDNEIMTHLPLCIYRQLKHVRSKYYDSKYIEYLDIHDDSEDINNQIFNNINNRCSMVDTDTDTDADNKTISTNISETIHDITVIRRLQRATNYQRYPSRIIRTKRE